MPAGLVGLFLFVVGRRGDAARIFCTPALLVCVWGGNETYIVGALILSQ